MRLKHKLFQNKLWILCLNARNKDFSFSCNGHLFHIHLILLAAFSRQFKRAAVYNRKLPVFHIDPKLHSGLWFLCQLLYTGKIEIEDFRQWKSLIKILKVLNMNFCYDINEKCFLLDYYFDSASMVDTCAVDSRPVFFTNIASNRINTCLF